MKTVLKLVFKLAKPLIMRYGMQILKSALSRLFSGRRRY
jgi:hypothetical protein